MNEPRTDVKISVYDTPAAIFEAFARVWPVTTSQGTTWVSFKADDVNVTMFKADDDTTAA